METAELREWIWEAQGSYCAMPSCRDRWTDMAHIVDASAGGERTPSNLIGLCRVCHANYDQNKRSSHRELMYYLKRSLLNDTQSWD